MFEWSFFLPSLIATLVGAALGIPIGLWLNRRAGEYQRCREEQQARQRKVAVLKALQEEVTHNFDLLNQMEDQLNKGGMPFYSLDTDMWMLLGSEVAQAVASEDTLTHVSRLYFEFEHIKRKLDAVFRNYADPNVAARSLGAERTAELRAATLGHMSPAKSLCKEVLELLREEIGHVVENSDAGEDRKLMVGDAASAAGRNSLAPSAVSSFLAAFLFLQARVIVAESAQAPVLLPAYLGFAILFLLIASLLLLSALTNCWTRLSHRVENVFWFAASCTTLAGLILSYLAGVVAVPSGLFWREWFFWLGLVWIVGYCVHFVRYAGEHGWRSRDQQ